MKPLLKISQIKLDEPSSSDKIADKERLINGISRQFSSLSHIEINLKTLRKLPSCLRKNNYSVRIVVSEIGNSIRIIDIVDDSNIYALAIDIGTTNIVGSLFDMNSCKRLCSLELENPQIALGLDVLTRVHFAMLGRSDELHKMLIKGLNDLIKRLSDFAGVNQSNIYAAVIAGNTIMSHFLLNLDVENIPIDPYIPVCNKFDFLLAADLRLTINPESVIYVYPNAGSYVGGDIISGILYSGLYTENLPSMLIDVGTNAEIVFGCKEWILVGAGAAGPALEGGISKIGMRAIEGAIYNLDIGDNCEVRYKTIASAEPKGICGSGMIELISEMFRKGIIDNQGRLQKICDKVVEINDKKVFIIFDSANMRLFISESDIENFLRSKAAMFASLFVITRSVGLHFKDINKIFVSGAFGKGIDAQKAKYIGMIPNIDQTKFIPLGNSSLKGAEMLLMDTDLFVDIEHIYNIITYKEMNVEGEFMKEFPAALFIPHTNPQILND